MTISFSRPDTTTVTVPLAGVVPTAMRGVGRSQHRRDSAGTSLRDVEPAALGGPGEGENDLSRFAEDDGDHREPRHPRPVVPSAGQPGTERRKLTGSSGRGEHLFPQGRRGLDRGRQREPGRRLTQPPHFSRTRGTVAQVALEPLPFRAFQSVQGIAAGQSVQLVALGHYPVISRQLRNRIRPCCIPGVLIIFIRRGAAGRLPSPLPRDRPSPHCKQCYVASASKADSVSAGSTAVPVPLAPLSSGSGSFRSLNRCF
jgi:hypothetical protein